MAILLQDGDNNGQATYNMLSPYIRNIMVPCAILNLPIYVAMVKEFRKVFVALFLFKPIEVEGHAPIRWAHVRHVP